MLTFEELILEPKVKEILSKLITVIDGYLIFDEFTVSKKINIEIDVEAVQDILALKGFDFLIDKIGKKVLEEYSKISEIKQK